MKKKFLTGCVLVSLALSTLTGCKIGNTEFVLDSVRLKNHSVFYVNEYECKIEEAKLYLCNYKNLYGTAFGVDLWEKDFDGDERLESYIKDVAINELSRIVCMDLLAEEQGISLSEEEIDLANQAAKEYFDSLSKEEKSFMGIDLNETKQFYQNYALACKLYSTLTEGVNEEVSDDEARVIRVEQIYVSTSEMADKVQTKIDEGTEFSIIANTFSQLSSVETTIARGDYPEAVEEIAFNMDDGEVSQMIPVENGYYFIKCISRFEEELTEANKGNILIRREKEQFNDVYEAFVENAEFVLNDEVWDEVTLEGYENSIQTDSFFSTYDKYFNP